MSHILWRLLASLRYPLTLLLGVLGMVLPFDGFVCANGCTSGCTPGELMTLAPGCSDWPNALSGALYIVPFMLILRWRPVHALFAVLPLVLLTALGGLGGIARGDHLYIDSIGDVLHLLQHGYAVLLGAAGGTLVWCCTSRHIMRFWAALAEP